MQKKHFFLVLVSFGLFSLGIPHGVTAFDNAAIDVIDARFMADLGQEVGESYGQDFRAKYTRHQDDWIKYCVDLKILSPAERDQRLRDYAVRESRWQSLREPLQEQLIHCFFCSLDEVRTLLIGDFILMLTSFRKLFGNEKERIKEQIPYGHDIDIEETTRWRTERERDYEKSDFLMTYKKCLHDLNEFFNTLVGAITGEHIPAGRQVSSFSLPTTLVEKQVVSILAPTSPAWEQLERAKLSFKELLLKKMMFQDAWEEIRITIIMECEEERERAQYPTREIQITREHTYELQAGLPQGPVACAFYAAYHLLCTVRETRWNVEEFDEIMERAQLKTLLDHNHSLTNHSMIKLCLLFPELRKPDPENPGCYALRNNIMYLDTSGYNPRELKARVDSFHATRRPQFFILGIQHQMFSEHHAIIGKVERCESGELGFTIIDTDNNVNSEQEETRGIVREVNHNVFDRLLLPAFSR